MFIIVVFILSVHILAPYTQCLLEFKNTTDFSFADAAEQQSALEVFSALSASCAYTAVF